MLQHTSSHLASPLRLALFFCLATLAGAGCAEQSGELAVLDLEPRAGATSGAQAVQIRGRNFRQDIGYTVYFGNKRAPSCTIVDTETLLVRTPSRDDSGAVDVVVAADDGPAFRIREAYRYEQMGGNVMEQLGQEEETSGERF